VVAARGSRSISPATDLALVFAGVGERRSDTERVEAGLDGKRSLARQGVLVAPGDHGGSVGEKEAGPLGAEHDGSGATTGHSARGGEEPLEVEAPSLKSKSLKSATWVPAKVPVLVPGFSGSPPQRQAAVMRPRRR
jgi:hypothetical protein